MECRKILLLLIFFMPITGFANGVGSSQKQRFQAISPLIEKLTRSADIANSGMSMVLGIVAADDFDKGAVAFGTEFEVYASHSGRLCINYRTRNGLYIGHQLFQADKKGWASITFDSKYKNDLQRIGGEQFAVRAAYSPQSAKSSKDCKFSNSTQTLMPVRSAKTSSFFVIAHVDGYPATVNVYKRDKGVIATGICRPLESSVSVEFDRKCEIPKQAFNTEYASFLTVSRPGKLQRELLKLPDIKSL